MPLRLICIDSVFLKDSVLYTKIMLHCPSPAVVSASIQECVLHVVVLEFSYLCLFFLLRKDIESL